MNYNLNQKELLIAKKSETENQYVELIDEAGTACGFNKLSKIEADGEHYYILKPTSGAKFKMGEAIVFKSSDVSDSVVFEPERNETKAIQIFLMYYKELFESVKQSKQSKKSKDAQMSMIKDLAKEYKKLLNS